MRWSRAPHEIKGAVGENLRQALDWLPKGRALLTIKKDCDLKDYIPGLPSLDDIAIGGQDTEALKAFYDKYGFKGLVKQLETHDVPPELIEEHRSKKKVGPAAGAPACSRSPTCRACRSAANLQLRHDLHLGRSSTTGWRGWRRPSWRPWTPRPVRSTRCCAEIVGLSLQREAGRGGLHSAGATATATRPSSCRARKCWRA